MLVEVGAGRTSADFTAMHIIIGEPMTMHFGGCWVLLPSAYTYDMNCRMNQRCDG